MFEPEVKGRVSTGKPQRTLQSGDGTTSVFRYVKECVGVWNISEGPLKNCVLRRDIVEI